MDNKTDQRYIGIPSMHKPEILRELSTVYIYILKEKDFLIKGFPNKGFPNKQNSSISGLAASYSYDVRNECKSL